MDATRQQQETAGHRGQTPTLRRAKPGAVCPCTNPDDNVGAWPWPLPPLTKERVQDEQEHNTWSSHSLGPTGHQGHPGATGVEGEAQGLGVGKRPAPCPKCQLEGGAPHRNLQNRTCSRQNWTCSRQNRNEAPMTQKTAYHAPVDSALLDTPHCPSTESRYWDSA
ncbi:Hypothetical predicted protein [Lynx pardinus]|uniref:Uncharacterized protein n=1 Tax=Lynx pardinus TaxID=191816 RepID=A0A485NU83_LYNPA|nr:Hypothetical predicted protein [Lynx pardinus]